MPKDSVTIEQAQPRKRLNAAERREQIIAGARHVFIEQGVNGARSRDIAERAGITEAYLYRHFRSKDEIFQLAIDAPLEELVARLREETRELANREDVDRADVLLRSHELFLECMVEIAPLAAAALLSQRGTNSRFFSDFLVPRLRTVLSDTIPDITGLPVEVIDIDLYVEAMVGIHLTIALEQLLENEPVDVPYVARQVTAMFASGVARPSNQKKKAARSKPSPSGATAGAPAAKARAAKPRPRTSPKA